MSDAHERGSSPDGDLDEFTDVPPGETPTPLDAEATQDASDETAAAAEKPVDGESADEATVDATPAAEPVGEFAEKSSGRRGRFRRGGARQEKAASARSGKPRTAGRLSGRSPSVRVSGIVATIAMVAALAAAGWYATTYGIALWDNHDDKKTSQTRDDALSGAEQVMLNVTTVDPGDLDGYKKRVASSVLGDVDQQLSGGGFDTLAKAGPSAGKLTSTIARSALVELSPDDGTAKALVFVTVTAIKPKQATSSQTMGFQLDMRKDGDTWKAQNIQALDGIQTADPTQAGGAGAPTAGAPTAGAPTSAAPSTPAPAGGN